MSLKSSRLDTGTVVRNIPPFLAEWLGRGNGKFTVLFYSPNDGVVVESRNPTRPVGDQGNFSILRNPEEWRFLASDEVIALSNS